MSLNLKVDNAFSTTAQTVKDDNGNASPLALSTDMMGIGTDNPQSKFHFTGDLTTDCVTSFSHDDPSFSVDNQKKVWLRKWWGEQQGDYLTISSSGNRSNTVQSAMMLTQNGGVLFGRGSDDGYGSLSQEWLRITPDGNVGIGTTTPAFPLSFPQSVGDKISLWGDNGDHYGFGIQGYLFQIHSNAADADIAFGYGSSLNFHDTMRIKGNGDILATGDIKLQGADCAEEFDLVEAATAIEPGTVMVLNNEGKLQPSENAYDKCVAGVISGAGDYKPGIVLDRKHEEAKRLPIALVGKVYCKVDADHGAIEVGDLLTTSPTPGHAMKAGDILKAFGTVLGKALCSLKAGKGLIPVLVALQ